MEEVEKNEKGRRVGEGEGKGKKEDKGKGEVRGEEVEEGRKMIVLGVMLVGFGGWM